MTMNRAGRRTPKEIEEAFRESRLKRAQPQSQPTIKPVVTPQPTDEPTLNVSREPVSPQPQASVTPRETPASRPTSTISNVSVADRISAGDPTKKFTVLSGGINANLVTPGSLQDRKSPVFRAFQLLTFEERMDLLLQPGAGREGMTPDRAAGLAYVASQPEAKPARRSFFSNAYIAPLQGAHNAIKGAGQSIGARILPGSIYERFLPEDKPQAPPLPGASPSPTPTNQPINAPTEGNRSIRITAQGPGAGAGQLAGGLLVPEGPDLRQPLGVLELTSTIPFIGRPAAGLAEGASLFGRAAVAVSGAAPNARLIPRLTGGATQRIAPDLRPFQETLDVTFEPTALRRAGETLAAGDRSGAPLRLANPTLAADTPVKRGLYAYAAQVDDAARAADVAYANLTNLGSLRRLFGATTKEGALRNGPFQGRTIQEVLETSQTPATQALLTPAQQTWIQRFRDVQDAGRDLLTRNGIEVGTARLDPGLIYINRRTVGKVNPLTGEIDDLAYVGHGPSRPGMKTTVEKSRIFATVDDAQKAGYVYLPPDQALYFNLKSAYRRVAQQQFAEWVKANPAIKTRNLGPRTTKLGTLEERRIGGVPAFSGTLFTVQDATAIRNFLGQQAEFNKLVDGINALNAIPRFFALAADASLFGIQMLAAVYRHPIVTGMTAGRFVEGFAKGLLDPVNLSVVKQSHADLVAKNAWVYDEIPNLLSTIGQGTEFTEVFRRRGFLPQTFQTIGVPLKPFQAAYEYALEAGGIYMARGMRNLARTPTERQAVGDYVNGMRGLISSNRLGLSGFQRQVESATLLAPRYRRAVAGVYASALQGGLRGRMAREALASMVTGVTLTYAGISFALYSQEGLTPGQITHKILRGLNPANPEFLGWEIDGQIIGVGSKVRSDLRFLGKLISEPTNIHGNVGTWLRSQVAGTAQLGLDLIKGENYLGEPNKDGLLQVRDVAADWLLPIWVQSIVLDGGDLGQRTTRAGAEFFGLRAYPFGIRALQNKASQERYRVDYEELATDDRYGEGYQREINALPEIQQAFEKSNVRRPVDERTQQAVKGEAYSQAKTKAVSQLRVALDGGLDGPQLWGAVGDLKEELFHASKALFADAKEAKERLPKDAFAVAYWSAQAPINPITLDADFTERDRERARVLADAKAAGVDLNYVTGRGKDTWRGSNPYGDEQVTAAVFARDDFQDKLNELHYFDYWQADEEFKSLTDQQQEWYESWRSAQGTSSTSQWLASLGTSASEARRVVAVVDGYLRQKRTEMVQADPTLDVGLVRYFDAVPQTVEGQREKVRLSKGTAAQLRALVTANKEGQIEGRLTEQQQAALQRAGITTLEQVAAMSSAQIWGIITKGEKQRVSITTVMRYNWPAQAQLILDVDESAR